MKPVVVVFAREPAPGRGKTRLAEGIGEAGAARVYAVLFEHVLEVARQSIFDVMVSFAEEPTPAWIDGREERWEVQRGDDLGERMRDAFDRRFGEERDRVIIVGSDCPRLQREHLSAAADALENAPVVIGPAIDGGYWLAAQRRPGVDLFSGVPWSTSDTLSATRTRLEDLGVRWIELDELDDVDTEDDLRIVLDGPDIDPELRERLLTAWKFSTS